MTSERFVDALNAQISREFAAAHQYTAIGAYYAAETYPQLTKFFYAQAEEEREHALKMVNYLLDRNAKVDFSEVSAPQTDVRRPRRADQARARAGAAGDGPHRRPVRRSRARRDDYLAEQFLHWFLEEQVEEESSMSDLLAVAERTREIPVLLEEYLARETPGDKDD